MSLKDKLAKKVSILNLDQKESEDSLLDIDTYRDGVLYNVPIEKINPNPNQPRKYFDPEALEELAQSIKQKGVLQPVIITTDERREIHLVAGERRYRAAKDAGLHKIPAIFTTGNPVEIAIIENVQREDLNPIEKAEAYKLLMEEHARSLEDVSNVVGKAKSTVSETLSLNKLPDEIKDAVRRAERYPLRLLVEVQKQKTPEAMIALFEQIKNNNLKSGDVRSITRKKSDTPQKTPAGVTLDKIKGLNKGLGKIDMSTVEEDERRQLITELRSLKAEIEKVLT